MTRKKQGWDSGCSNNAFGALDSLSAFEPLAVDSLEEDLDQAAVWQPRSLALRFERKGRGGKLVTILFNFEPQASEPDLQPLLKTLKNAMGCGGRICADEMELQGDRRTAVAAYLKENFNVSVKGDF